MAISLAGVTGLQWYWVDEAIDLKEKEFAQSAQKALSNTVDDLESAHATFVFEERVGGPGSLSFDILMSEVHENSFVEVTSTEIRGKEPQGEDTEVIIWADSGHHEEDIQIISTSDEDNEM